MAGVLQHQPVVRREDRPHTSVLRGPAALGAQHVHFREIIARIGDQPGVGTYRLGELGEYAHDLAPLGIFQLAQFVVDLHHLDRLDVEGLSRRRFVVDESVELAFVTRGDRNHGPPVADRNLGVGIDDTRPLGRSQHGLQAFGRLSLAFADGPANLLKGGRGVVLHVAEAVEDALDALHDLRKRRHAARAGVHRRIALFAAEDESDDAADDRQRLMQNRNLLHVEERTLDTQFGRRNQYRDSLLRENRAPCRARGASRRPAPVAARSRAARSKSPRRQAARGRRAWCNGPQPAHEAGRNLFSARM